MNSLWLVGMMGSGKTAVGALVAEQVRLPFLDIDSRIEAECSQSILSIFATDGEEAFRDLETEQILRIVTAGVDGVIATGGGAVLRAANVSAMRSSGLVVWLTAVPEVLAARLGDDQSRPLLYGRQTHDRLVELLEERFRWYEEAAHHIVETVDRSPHEVAQEVMVLWNVF